VRARLLWLCAVWALMVVAWAKPGACHDVVPGALSLEEGRAGRFLVRWTAPSAARTGASRVDPEFPEHCQLVERAIDCGARGLSGELRFAGLEGTIHRVVVRIVWQGGREEMRVASGERPVLELRGGRAEGWAELAGTIAEFTRLGVAHILGGFDHLLFVIGLVLLVRDGRRLLLTVTAFTVAHSLTLAASVLGWLTVPSGAVEATIALSIVLLAWECASPRESLTRRAPWWVAFSFGLLHGFGFAGALSEVGLPPHQLAVALASFNLGVELGQLSIVFPLWLGLRWLGRFSGARRLELGLVYLIGTLSVYWTIDRVSLLLST
jgi:hydrogenase/urease accessory protein HupE